MSGLVQVFVDGAARNQGSSRPTEAACAVVITYNREVIVQFAQGLGNVTNNVAEYQALISALIACSIRELPIPIIYSDSKTVVNQVNGVWRCLSHDLLPYYITVKDIQGEFPFKLVQVPRSKVFLPDTLCNILLDKIQAERKRLPKKTVDVSISDDSDT